MGDHTLRIYFWRRFGVGPKRYDWQLIHQNGQVIATSGHQGYNDERVAERMGKAVASGEYRDFTVERAG